MKKGALKNTFSRVNGDKLAQHFFASLRDATKCLRSASPKNSRKDIFQSSKKIVRFKSEQEWIQSFVDRVTDSAMRAVSDHGVFRMGLSGGETPKPLYQALAKVKDFPWSKTELSLVDERDVPLDDPRSNYRMIQEELMGRVRKRTFSEASADLFILGIGSDGHTASLFPNSPALQVEDQWVVKTEPYGNPFVARYTLTYPALVSAREIIFLLRGKEKEAILKKVQTADPSDLSCPAARIFHLPQTKMFYCEE